MKHLFSPAFGPAIRQFLIKLILLGLLIILQYWQPGIAHFTELPSRFVQAMVLFLAGEGLIALNRWVLVIWYRRRNEGSPGKTDNFVLGIYQISLLLSIGVLLAAILLVLNIQIGEALTTLSIIATALVILFKEYIANIINGMILLFSAQISIHDWVKIGNQEGRIVNMNLLNVQLLNDEEDVILIPNSSVFNEEVVNYSRRAIRKVSIEFEMALSKVNEVEALEAYLIEALSPFENRIQANSFNLKTMEVHKDFVLFKFQYLLIDQTDSEAEHLIRKATIRSVVRFQARQVGAGGE